jgi:hypothetical protein
LRICCKILFFFGGIGYGDEELERLLLAAAAKLNLAGRSDSYLYIDTMVFFLLPRVVPFLLVGRLLQFSLSMDQ